MKQQVRAKLVLSFDDAHLQKDVDEALESALKTFQASLGLLPRLPGKSTTGKKIAFRLEEVIVEQKTCMGRCVASNPCVLDEKHQGDHVCASARSCGCAPSP